MRRRTLTGAFAAASLGLAITTAAVPTFAAGHAHGAVGKITQVSSTSLTVQTASGSITDALTSNTVVIKNTAGSLGDLTKGAFVTVTLASNGTTVTAVDLETKPAGTTHTHKTRTGTTTSTPHKTRKTGTTGTTTTAPTKKVNAGLHRGGQVVSVSNGQLVLSGRAGQTATYTLGSTVKVTKTVRGQLSDLAVGQTVRVAGSPTAFAVIIENA